jgi:hypothetical protein
MYMTDVRSGIPMVTYPSVSPLLRTEQCALLIKTNMCAVIRMCLYGNLCVNVLVFSLEPGMFMSS